MTEINKKIGLDIDGLRIYPLHTKLLKLRLVNGLSQVNLAKKMQCATRSISDWELGIRAPSDLLLEKIRQFYNLPLDYFDNDKDLLRKA